MTQYIVDNGTRFDNNSVIAIYIIGQHWRLAQLVNLLQFRGRQISQLIPFVLDDLVIEFELFKQPEDSLRAGVIKMMDFEHRVLFL
jgi:hypothetical protein